MQNLEQKFRCADLAAATAAAVAMGATDRGLLLQHDLFFSASHARLKLRLQNSGGGAAPQRAELISYLRPDASRPRTCDYHLYPVSDPEALIAVLTQSLGTPRSLKKTRRLFIYGATRIHLDTVDGFPPAADTFCELETVLTTQSLAEAQSEIAHVIATLHLTESIPTAYIDLLRA